MGFSIKDASGVEQEFIDVPLPNEGNTSMVWALTRLNNTLSGVYTKLMQQGEFDPETENFVSREKLWLRGLLNNF